MIDFLSAYDFHFDAPVRDGLQSIPLGNGEVGANVWLEADGAVRLLISRTDAWSESMRLIKTGLIKLHLNPNPFEGGAKGTFSLQDATLLLTGGGVQIRAYMDAHAPCLRVKVESETPISARIEIVNYRDCEYDWGKEFSCFMMQYSPVPFPESSDVAFSAPGFVGQYHYNESSCYQYALRTQALSHFQGIDPLLHRAFGCAACGNYPSDGHALIAEPAKTISFSVYSLSLPDTTPVLWRRAMDDCRAAYGLEQPDTYLNHCGYWKEQWEKCYVHCPGEGHEVARAFLYQRYMNLIAGSGEYPVKFNGSLFTAGQIEGHPGNYDERRWGGPYWIQNTRLIYWALLASGDYEQVKPLLRFLIGLMPICKERVRSYYNHEGMLLPETFSIFGTYTCRDYGHPDETGRHRDMGTPENGVLAFAPGQMPSRYLRWHYNGMVELAYLMMRYVELSGDAAFLPDALAFGREVLKFFLNHFEYIGGKLMMFPVSSLETWQVCVNDAPDVAGLRALSEAMRAAGADEATLALCLQMEKALPELPVEIVNGRKLLAPCETKIEKTPQNVENPELYAVFPYGLYGLGKPDLEVARDTYYARQFRHAGGWSTDPILAARLGLTEEAKRHLLRESVMIDPRCIFPAFWGPNFDETPDQDHGGVVLTAIVNMLLQPGEKALVLPAWPREWDVEFRLPLGRGRSMHAIQRGGQLELAENVPT